MTNGADALIRTLVASGVTVCFANPGTSEMHFVAALDAVPRMRGVLTLFEGVATGAADGYARVSGHPAATLLHLGPGLSNGLANLHNARRAATPVVNVVGDHTTYHHRYDAPLTADIAALAGTVGWFRASTTLSALAEDAAEAVAVARAGRVATLVLPADVSWTDGATPASPRPAPVPPPVTAGAVRDVARILTTGLPAALVVGAAGTHDAGLLAASRIATATGARLYTEMYPSRLARGAGLPAAESLGYRAEQVAPQLAGVRALVLAGAPLPVAFFAYPGEPSVLVPDGCDVHVLATPAEDVVAALESLADEVAPATAPTLVAPASPAVPPGPLTPVSWPAVIGAELPAGAIVVDETNTAGAHLLPATAAAPRHDLIAPVGGAIGDGMPLAVGAAVAAPTRPVVCLQADGSAMYTPTALWTMAREKLDVTTVILNNRSYAILELELDRVGGGTAGPVARSLLSLTEPHLDFVALAASMGVPATRATTTTELAAQFRAAVATPGPHLIEALLEP